jgi:hypothetical protein
VSGRILPPFKTHSAGDIPGLILLGRLVIFDHGRLDNDPDIDPPGWRARARTACAELGVAAEFHVVPEADLAIIFSPANQPVPTLVSPQIHGGVPARRPRSRPTRIRRRVQVNPSRALLLGSRAWRLVRSRDWDVE